MKAFLKSLKTVLPRVTLLCLGITAANCKPEIPRAEAPSLKASAAKHTAYVGETVPLSLAVTPVDHRFHITEKADKKGVLRDAQGKPLTAWYTQQSQWNKLYFKPMERGVCTLTFQATDEAKHSVRDTLELSVKSAAFTVKPEFQQREVHRGEGVQIGFHIEDQADKACPKYFRFESDLKGSLHYAGNTYTQGDTIEIGAQTEVTTSFQA